MKYKSVTSKEFYDFSHETVLMSFPEQIAKMQNMYKLPNPKVPTLEVGELASVRIGKFIRTLNDEISEGSEIQEALLAYENGEPNEDAKKELLVDLADWFADITIYCASEAMKYGIPLEQVQSVIMASNFSKLGIDGLPTYNSDGKVLKGPNFQTPEAFIKAIM